MDKIKKQTKYAVWALDRCVVACGDVIKEVPYDEENLSKYDAEYVVPPPTGLHLSLGRKASKARNKFSDWMVNRNIFGDGLVSAGGPQKKLFLCGVSLFYTSVLPHIFKYDRSKYRYLSEGIESNKLIQAVKSNRLRQSSATGGWRLLTGGDQASAVVRQKGKSKHWEGLSHPWASLMHLTEKKIDPHVWGLLIAAVGHPLDFVTDSRLGSRFHMLYVSVGLDQEHTFEETRKLDSPAGLFLRSLESLVENQLSESLRNCLCHVEKWEGFDYYAARTLISTMFEIWLHFDWYCGYDVYGHEQKDFKELFLGFDEFKAASDELRAKWWELPEIMRQTKDIGLLNAAKPARRV